MFNNSDIAFQRWEESLGTGMDRHRAEKFVIGPDGERMTMADLPSTDTHRWVPRRKAQIVAAVEGGLISQEGALRRYRLTAEEYDGWKEALTRFGMRGLRVTRVNRSRGIRG